MGGTISVESKVGHGCTFNFTSRFRVQTKQNIKTQKPLVALDGARVLVADNMDMQMPVMDGYAALREIRNWEKKKGLKPVQIIAVTAYAMKDEFQKSMNASCNVHITKPFSKR